MDFIIDLDWKLKIVESQTQIQKLIIIEIEKYLRPKLHKIRNILDGEMKIIFHNSMINSQEYKSLIGEKNMAGGESLMGHFGFSSGEAQNKVDTIVNKWVDGIHSEIFLSKTSGKLSAGIGIYGISESFADVLGMPEAVQDTTRTYKVGLLRIPTSYTTLLPWLRILLFQGTRTVLMTDHTITFNPRKLDTSRSKQAIMIKAKSRRWFIPEPFAGTITDNWVLRVLDQEVYPKIKVVIENTLRNIF